MSEVYVLEPPTNGKVVLHTTHGSIDIELWSKECPKTCRNFLQLCIDGYYDGTIFHRIIPDFIVQGGDPTGTGLGTRDAMEDVVLETRWWRCFAMTSGGESIYGDAPFPTEIHPRLMYRYRGLVGLATLNPESEETEEARRDPDRKRERKYGSQFFITLARADSLNRKNTLFGKVTGNSLYNLLSLAETPADPQTGRPHDPPRIRSVEILYCPFDDILPRPGSAAMIKAELELEAQKRKLEGADGKAALRRETLAVKKKNLLSFEVDEDSSDETCDAAHGDPSPGACRSDGKEAVASQPGRKDVEHATTQPSEDIDAEKAREKKARQLKERIAHQLMPKHVNDEKDEQCSLEHEDTSERDDSEEQESGSSDSEPQLQSIKTRREENQKEIERLRAEILTFKKGEGTASKEEREANRVEDADLLTDFEKRRRLKATRQRQYERKRQHDDIMSKMQEFQKRLRSPLSVNVTSNSDSSGGDQNEDAAPLDWFSGDGLKFAVDSARAYELDAANDALVTFDPLASRPKGEVEEKFRRLQNLVGVCGARVSRVSSADETITEG